MSDRIYWLSFVDDDRPPGSRFLGVAIVRVTEDHAAELRDELAERFPNARPGAEWIAAAVRRSWRLGCNPGGEIATSEIPEEDWPRVEAYLGRLLSTADLDRAGFARA
jgi:hypothetical protein